MKINYNDIMLGASRLYYIHLIKIRNARLIKIFLISISCKPTNNSLFFSIMVLKNNFSSRGQLYNQLKINMQKKDAMQRSRANQPKAGVMPAAGKRSGGCRAGCVILWVAVAVLLVGGLILGLYLAGVFGGADHVQLRLRL